MGVSVGIGGMGGGMEGAGGGGINSQVMTLVQTLPPWLAATLGTLAVLALAALAGLILGKVIGNFIYPDPDKPSVLTRGQKLLVFCAVAAACWILGYNLHKTLAPPEDPSMEVGGSMDPGGMMGEGDENPDAAPPEGEEGQPAGDEGGEGEPDQGESGESGEPAPQEEPAADQPAADEPAPQEVRPNPGT